MTHDELDEMLRLHELFLENDARRKCASSLCRLWESGSSMSGNDSCWCRFGHKGQTNNAYMCLPFSILGEHPYLRAAFLECGCNPDRGEVGVVLRATYNTLHTQAQANCGILKTPEEVATDVLFSYKNTFTSANQGGNVKKPFKLKDTRTIWFCETGILFVESFASTTGSGIGIGSVIAVILSWMAQYCEPCRRRKVI